MKHILAFVSCIFISYSFSQIPNYVPSDGLVGWWPFNGNANDESGNQNNGIINGASLTQDRFAKVNSAYSFDGLNDFISINNSSSLNITGSQITISFWLFNQKNDNMHKGISKGGWDVGCGFEFLYSDNNTIQLSGAYGGLQRIDNNPLNILNKWDHLVAVFNNGVGFFYVNGTKVDAKLNGNQFKSFVSCDYPLIFGKRSDQNFNLKGFVHGKMDDIGIWKRALTEAEILALYNNKQNETPINCELARKSYLEKYPDVKANGADPWTHYTLYGKNEGRIWPSCEAVVSKSVEENCESARKEYLEKYPDVKVNGADPWTHYTLYGKNEGRIWPKCDNLDNNNQIGKPVDIDLSNQIVKFKWESKGNTEFINTNGPEWTQKSGSLIFNYESVSADNRGILLKDKNRNGVFVFLEKDKCQYKDANSDWSIKFYGNWVIKPEIGCSSGNCQNGFGIKVYNDGIYKGNFIDNKRNGYGEFESITGLLVSGNYVNDSCCTGLSTHENIVKKNVRFINMANNKKDYYCLELNTDEKNSRFYSYIGDQFYYEWGGDKQIDSIMFPSPKYTFNRYNYPEHISDYRVLKDRNQIVYCAFAEPSDAMKRSWFKIVDLNTGAVVRSYGNQSNPIKSSGYSTLKIIDIVDDFLIFEQENETNGVISLKFIDLNSSQYGVLQKSSQVYAKFMNKNYLKIEKMDNLTTLVFVDSSGNPCKKHNFLDVQILDINNEFVTILKRINKINNNGSYQEFGSYIHTFSRNGLSIDSVFFKGSTVFKVHPNRNKYLVSYEEDNANIVSEFSLMNLDSLIRVVDIKENFSGYRIVNYSPAGQFILIDKGIYLENKLYFGLLGVPTFLNNDNCVVFHKENFLYGYDLIEGKLKWLFDLSKLLQKANYQKNIEYLISDGVFKLIDIGGDENAKLCLRILKVQFESAEQNFEEVITATIKSEIQNKIIQENVIKNDNISTNSNSPRTCSFALSKPSLNITWVDNRVKCCNPYCKMRSQYHENKKDNLERAEINYLFDLLKAHYLETNCDNNHKASDGLYFTEIIPKLYAKTESEEFLYRYFASELATKGIAVQSILEGMVLFETPEQKIQRFRNKKRSIPIYSVTSSYCSKNCKEYCELVGIKCKK